MNVIGNEVKDIDKLGVRNKNHGCNTWLHFKALP